MKNGNSEKEIGIIEKLKAFGRFMLLTIIFVAPLLLMSLIFLVNAEHMPTMWVILAFIFYIVAIVASAMIISKFFPKIENFPKFNWHISLLGYALFISLMATGYYNFFETSSVDYVNKSIPFALVYIGLGLFFLFFAYRGYFNDTDKEKRIHDFLISISASLSVALLASVVKWLKEKNFSMTDTEWFIVAFVIIFVGFSYLVIFMDIKKKNKKP